jgi:hypothetical protein
VFRGQIQGETGARALRAVQPMGYELQVTAATLLVVNDTLDVTLTMTNTGVAPFYYDWAVELAALDSAGKLVKTWKPEWKMTDIVPGAPATTWHFRSDDCPLPVGVHHVLLRIPNPLPNGPPLRFANQAQDRHLPGWLTLGAIDRSARLGGFCRGAELHPLAAE